MNDKDFASADVMVLGALILHFDSETTAYAMSSVEK